MFTKPTLFIATLTLVWNTTASAQREGALILNFDAYLSHLNYQALQQLNSLASDQASEGATIAIRSWACDSLRLQPVHWEAALIQRRVNMAAQYLTARGVDSTAIDVNWWEPLGEHPDAILIGVHGSEMVYSGLTAHHP